MKRAALLLATLVLFTACGAGGSADSADPTATPAAMPTATPTVTPAASPTPAEARLDSLDGTEWIVTEIGGELVAEEFVARFRFVNRTEIGATIACDGAGTSYRLTGSLITLTGRIERTHFGCDESQDPDDEGALLFDAWERVYSFQATESRLAFFDVDGASLFTLDRFVPPPLDPALKGDWVVSELDGKPPIAGVLLSLSIGYEGVGGFSGCNEFGGHRSPLESNALAIESMFTNAAGCPDDPPGLLEQEQFFQNAVGSAASYEVDAQTLELLDAQGAVLVLLDRIPKLDMNPADLVGTSWRLVSMTGIELQEDAGITLHFDSATEMSGFAGWRDYSATYSAEGDKLRPTSFAMGSTEGERGEDYMLLEGQFTSMLGNARRYALDADTLTITSRNGEMLEFVRMAE